MSRRGTLHEDYARGHEVHGGSDRAFGFVVAAALVVLAGLPLLHGGAPRWWLAAPALPLAAVAWLAPARLAPLNRAWQRLGLFLARVVNPVILGVIFYAVVLPVGLVMRLFGHDPLRLRFEREAQSYWIPRDPPGPPPETMRNQF